MLLVNITALQKWTIIYNITIKRRKTLPVYMSADTEVNLWNILKKNIGKDLTKVC